jgi:hypothetical protein
MDPYLNYHHAYRLMQEQLRVREMRHQRAWKSHEGGAWQRMLDRPRAFFESHLARQRRLAPPPPLPEADSEVEWLIQRGFSPDQIALFQRLKRWYAMCNQERSVMLSHWEFLRRLVNSGQLEP